MRRKQNGDENSKKGRTWMSNSNRWEGTLTQQKGDGKIDNRIEKDSLALEHIWSNSNQKKKIFVDDPTVSPD